VAQQAARDVPATVSEAGVPGQLHGEKSHGMIVLSAAVEYLLPGRQVIPVNGGSRFPFRVLRGKQHEMGYLLAGFDESDFPAEIRGFPRVQFVPWPEVSSLGQISTQIQVGIFSARLDGDDLEWLQGQFTRAGIPRENVIVEKNPRVWIGWLRREFDIPRVNGCGAEAEPPALKLVVGCGPEPALRTPGSDHIVWWPDAAKHDCAHLPIWTETVFLSNAVGPMARQEIEEEVLRRGLRLVYFDDREELLSYLTAEARVREPQDLPKVVLLGIHRHAAAAVLGNPLYRYYGIQDTARLTALPRPARLVVMATRHSNPDTVLRMKQLAGAIEAKFIEIIGGAGAVKRWLARTNVEEELGGPAEEPAAPNRPLIHTDLEPPEEDSETDFIAKIGSSRRRDEMGVLPGLGVRQRCQTARR
jgi:hypothetical protein